MYHNLWYKDNRCICSCPPVNDRFSEKSTKEAPAPSWEDEFDRKNEGGLFLPREYRDGLYAKEIKHFICKVEAQAREEGRRDGIEEGLATANKGKMYEAVVAKATRAERKRLLGLLPREEIIKKDDVCPDANHCRDYSDGWNTCRAEVVKLFDNK